MNCKSKWKNSKKLKLWFKREKPNCIQIDNNLDIQKRLSKVKEISRMFSKIVDNKVTQDQKDYKNFDNLQII